MDQDIVSALVKAVEIKDQSTAAHTWRVGLYSQAMAEAAGLEHDQVERIMRAAVLHDIGKIDVPNEILAKPSKLTPEEYEIIKTHAVSGHDRLVRMGETDPLVLGLVRSHHERLNGSGYPDALSGEDIPPVARYFAVIDAFDAMTSLRPYRQLTGEEAARNAIIELKQFAGQWYWPPAVQLFADLYDTGALEWILHYFNDAHAASELTSAPDHALLRSARQRTNGENGERRVV